MLFSSMKVIYLVYMFAIYKVSAIACMHGYEPL